MNDRTTRYAPQTKKPAQLYWCEALRVFSALPRSRVASRSRKSHRSRVGVFLYMRAFASKTVQDRNLAPNRANLGPTWWQLKANLGQLRSTWASLGANLCELGAYFGPTWEQLGPTYAYLEPTWSQLGSNLRPTWGQEAPSCPRETFWGRFCINFGMCSVLGTYNIITLSLLSSYSL